MQEKDVRNHLCPGVGLESVIRQANGPQQVGPLREILPYLGILCIQGIPAGDKCHHAAGAHPVQRFGEEIVVDVESQLVVLPVVHRIIPKRDIAHSEVEEVPGELCFLIALHDNIGIGIELLGNAPADAVQLHAVELGTGHALRQEAEEVAHAAGGFQDIAALIAHIGDSLIDGLDDGGAGVMGIEGGSPCRSIFLRGKRRLQFQELTGPVCFIRVKGIGQTAPAHIAG